MKVIVGLGNPGPSYSHTRHNVGFSVVDRLGKQWSIPVHRELCSSRVGEGAVGAEKVRLVLPQTFMNSSGEAVACLFKRWKLDLESILLVCDDLALPLGMIRVRAQGSDGGHQGLSSVFKEMNSRQINRLRIGVLGGAVAGNRTPVVLGKFSPAEKPALEEGLDRAVQACGSWVTDGILKTMNHFNRKATGSL